MKSYRWCSNIIWLINEKFIYFDTSSMKCYCPLIHSESYNLSILDNLENVYLKKVFCIKISWLKKQRDIKTIACLYITIKIEAVSISIPEVFTFWLRIFILKWTIFIYLSSVSYRDNFKCCKQNAYHFLSKLNKPMNFL